MAKHRGQAKQQQSLQQQPQESQTDGRQTDGRPLQEPQPHEEMAPARNLPDAASADQSLQGYAAVNGLNEEDIARRAYELYLSRQRDGLDGSPDGDWYRAEQEVRRDRPQTGITQE